MSPFCGSENYGSFFLNNSGNDLNPCFEVSVLRNIPLLALFIFCLFVMWPTYMRPIMHESLIISRSWTVLASVILMIEYIVLLLFRAFVGEENYTGAVYLYVNYILTAVAWGLVAFYLKICLLRNITPSVWVKVFVFFEIALALKRLESIILLIEQTSFSISKDWELIPCIFDILMFSFLLVKLLSNNEISDSTYDPILPLNSSINADEDIRPSIWSRLLQFSSTNDPTLPFTDLSVTSWMEVTVANRCIVQFAVKVKSVKAGTYKVWRTVNDFELLQQRIAATRGINAPQLQLSSSASLLSKRDILDKYLQDLLVTGNPSIMTLLSSFTDLEERMLTLFPPAKKSVSTSRNVSFVHSDTHSPNTLLLEDEAETPRNSKVVSANIDAAKRRQENLRKEKSMASMLLNSESPPHSLTNSVIPVSNIGSVHRNSSLGCREEDNEFEDVETEVDVLKSAATMIEEKGGLSTTNQVSMRAMRGVVMLSFIGWVKVKPLNDKEYVLYSIAVRAKTGDWVVQKRFQHFVKLYEALLIRCTISNNIVPELPKKSSGIFGRNEQSEEYLEYRRVCLEIWLQKVVNTLCFQCPELFRFLSATPGTVIGEQGQLNLPTPADDSGNPLKVLLASPHVNIFSDPSWGTHFFDSEVVRWQIQEADSKYAHVVYTVVVKEFYSRTEFISWQITKRYREFETLHTVLSKKFPDIGIPDLPPKKLNSQKSSVINERVKLLECFLHQLINTTHFQIDELFAFLDLHNPQRNIITGTAFKSNEDS